MSADNQHDETRCRWAGGAPEFVPYHDEEWGFPVDDDRRLFEKIALESFQSGLSWRTILNKRESFRRAFCGFDFEAVARFGTRDRNRLLADASIVRHRGKIDATINNAARAIELVEEFGSIAAFVWQYEPDPASRPSNVTDDWVYATPTSPESKALSRDLKRRGWAFVGPTTAYAFMQAMGLVNDHTDTCCVRQRALDARAAFTPPV